MIHTQLQYVVHLNYKALQQQMFSKLTVALVFSALAALQASASPATTLTRARRGQCNGDQVTCNLQFAANKVACQQLINSIAANPNNILPPSPRFICSSLNGDQCCISWADDVQGLTQGALLSMAQTQLECEPGNAIVSAFAHNVDLNGECTAQCLSNRPDGCTD
ncbi:hypothetical protein FB45DRAFT_1034498 [Roridomyces roridus]|uniref:WD-like domain-containing protein n=1 Tax=Roridomyces roridus TaxID=1738132 RepID=A0AAD7BD46_9AGAR|nr:hypothetical protein FB45DRAFT_1034498 [Roridomyces roridus]